ncbi:Glycosyltransferase 25 family member [Aphelenchoides bicaudatus]|nr:Glycosyltransferase 25 family member [Aphelenchoides bicaudatus]
MHVRGDRHSFFAPAARMQSKNMLLLLLIFTFSLASALFPGATPDEGDYRHLYGKICLTFRVFETPHIFPYSMGWIENLRYPKDRMHIQFLFESNSVLADQITKWSDSSNSKLYLSTTTSETTNDEWFEQALVFGRRKSCDYAFLLTTDILLSSNALLNLIELNSIVVSPLVLQPFGYHSNGYGLSRAEHLTGDKLELLSVYFVRPPILINLKNIDSSYLTFDADNLRSYTGPNDPFSVSGFSAFQMQIPVFLDNHHFYGYFLDSQTLPKIEHKSILSSLLNQLFESHSIPHSAALEPWFPEPSSFGFDNIFVINLKRRPRRLERMKTNMKLLGVQFSLFEAVDGQALTDEDLKGIRVLPGYLDPYHKRPIKRGEIGCFLSHYKIWEQVVANDWDRVLIFEDDIRFTENATKILRHTVEDLMKTQIEWDLIYLGRKKNDVNAKEFFVKGENFQYWHRYLSTVTYSYWTLGYALSRQGAKKLLDAQPLDKLIALDEFLPIMYNQHPNTEWSGHFRDKTLRAFTVYPLVVQPMRYTHEPGYLSDTEDSIVVNSTHSHQERQQASNAHLNLHAQFKHDEF